MKRDGAGDPPYYQAGQASRSQEPAGRAACSMTREDENERGKRRERRSGRPAGTALYSGRSKRDS